MKRAFWQFCRASARMKGAFWQFCRASARMKRAFWQFCRASARMKRASLVLDSLENPVLKRLFPVAVTIPQTVWNLPLSVSCHPSDGGSPSVIRLRVRAYIVANNGKHVCHLYHLTPSRVRWYRWHTCFLFITTIVQRHFFTLTGGPLTGGCPPAHSSSHCQAGITSICFPLSNGTVPSSS